MSSTIGAGGAILLGRTVVSNILKMVPAIGSVAGGAISASTAAVITVALGEAYIGIFELVFKGEMSFDKLSSENGKKLWLKCFKKTIESSG